MSDDLYAKFDRKKSRAENDWIRIFVLPFHNAYIDAHKNFMDKIDEQKKADEEKQKRIAELAMLALTFAAASSVGRVRLGGAEDARGRDRGGLPVRHNMNRTFTAIMFVAENKTAQLALGKLWDKGQDLLSSELKKNGGNQQKFPSLADFALSACKNGQPPGEMGARRSRQVLAAENEISAQIKDPQRRATAIQNLLDAPFLSTAPEKPLAGARTIEEMELSFYMRYILDLDYIASGHTTTSRCAGTVGIESGRQENADLGKPDEHQVPAGREENGKNFERRSGYCQSWHILRKPHRRARQKPARRCILPAEGAPLANACGEPS